MSPVDAPHPPRSARGSLPEFPTAFIGRTADLLQVRQALATARLLTLTGPGGSGKTRLARQAAGAVQGEYADGAWWCDLAGVTDPAYVAQTVSQALRLGEPVDRPALDHLTTALHSQQALLVLDNCEHLLAACAALCQAVLRACPGVRLLATCLQPLGLPEERVWPVPPLSLAQPAEPALEPDAVRLFVDRAARVRPAFQLTPENRPAVLAICRQLDGLPLALELAAARTRLLTVEQIAERLGDALALLTRGSVSRVPRHQTLRLAIDWSCQFLSSDEQALLRRLAVFAGPFTVAMVEGVCGEQTGDSRTLDLLDQLADKSLVVIQPQASGETHCRLLEVIRQYAREKLEESGEAAPLRDAYLNWCVAWAEKAAHTLTGPGRAAGLAQFEARQEHFRSALRWACTAGRAEVGLRLAVALGRYWLTSGLSEGRTWLEELLALEAEPVPAGVRAWALVYAGRLAERQGDPAHGLRRGEESLQLFRAAGDVRGRLAALNLLALAAQDSNDYDRAEAHYAEGLAVSREASEERQTAVLLVNQGLMYYEQQDYPRAAPIWREAYALIDRLADDSIASRDNLACLAMMQGQLAEAQTLLEHELQREGVAGDPFAVGILLMDLGEVARRRGDFARAGKWLHEALERQQQLADRLHVSETLANLGHLARNQGDVTAAQAYYEQCLAGVDSHTDLTGQVQIGLGLLASAQGRAEEALALFRSALQIALAGRRRLTRVAALEGLAGLWASQGDARRAATWLAVTAHAREALGAPIPPAERGRYDQWGQEIHHALGAETLATIRAEAGSVTLEQLEGEVFGPAPDPVSSAAAELQVLALGSAQVQVGGRLIEPAAWTYAKSKELLFYLLARGPASKAQIGLDLWPEASPQQLRASFHTALHHLRQALGGPAWIVHTAGAYSVNSDRHIAYDVQAFEDQLRQARQAYRAAAQPAQRARAIAHLEAATALWRGDYLADVAAGDWALYQREALRQAFLEGLLQLAELHFGEAHYPAAAATYQRALALDNYLELAHRGLMRCYARQGETAQAGRHYQTLRQLLRQELNTAPSPETSLLFERLQRGDDV